MIKGAIFDIDGTLLDSMPIWTDVGARYLRSIGVTPEEGLGEILFSMTMEEGAAYLRRTYNLSQTETDIQQGIVDIIGDFYRYEVQLKSGMRELLEQLYVQSIPMTLATTGERELAEAALTRLGVWRYFSAMFTANELHTSKKEPLIYHTAANFMGTAPHETMVYEDVIHALTTAKNAGFQTTAVEDAASRKDKAAILAIADHYIGSRD